MRRIMANLVSGIALAMGLSMSMTVAAQASVTPDPNVFYEIYPPYISPAAHKCLDVPSASRSEEVPLQIFHCHGYASNGANQLWEFVSVGAGNYWIVNKNSGLCMADFFVDSPPGTATYQYDCGAVDWEYWRIVPSAFDPDGFELASVYLPEYCLAALDSSGRDQTRVVLYPCDNSPTFGGRVQTEDWRLG
jgi:hypothetical protein